MSTATQTMTHVASRRSNLDGALRSEVIKLTSVRGTWLLLGINIVGGLIVSFAVGALVTDEILTVAEVGFYWTVIAAVLAAICAVLMFTADAQHGTLAPAIAARPARTAIAAAKAAVATFMGAAFGVLGIVAGFCGAALSGIDNGELSVVPTTSAWAVLYTALSALLGLGLGMIVRHGAGAISGLLVWGFVVENLLLVFIPAEIARFLPFFAGNHLLDLDSDIDSAEAIAVALSRLQNAAVFAGYAVVSLGIGTILLKRRDVD
jgi:ABC-type transport system involved in multi-copper enzyme maturation permease subunit